MHLRTGLLACSKTDCMSEKSRRSISVIISSVYKCPLGYIPIGYRIVIPKREAHRLKLPVAYRKLIAAMIGYLRQTGGVWQWPRTMYIPNKYMPLPTTNSPPSFPSADPVMYIMYSRPIIWSSTIFKSKDIQERRWYLFSRMQSGHSCFFGRKPDIRRSLLIDRKCSPINSNCQVEPTYVRDLFSRYWC